MLLWERPPDYNKFLFYKYYAKEPVGVTLYGKDVSIYYLETGRVGNPLIILLHGVGSLGGQFFENNVAQTLASAGFHVVAPDLPGHGRTLAPKEDDFYEMTSLAILIERFTLAILKKHRSPTCLWAAHSLSAGAVLRWAALISEGYPNRIPNLSGIMAISMPISVHLPPLIAAAALPSAPNYLPRILARVGYLYFYFYIRSIINDPKLRSKALRLYYPRSEANLRAQIRYINRNRKLITEPSVLYPFRDCPPRLPIRFVHGAKDAMFSALYVNLMIKRFLPNTKFIIKQNGGHNLVDDEPEEIACEITKFARDCAIINP